MVDVEDCEKEMIEALNGFFSRGVIADRKPVRNDAYFNLIADKIIKDLDKARVSIHVCIAWFTNQNIADKLVEKYKQGIDVKVIFYDDHTNSKFGVNIDGIPFKAVRGSRVGLIPNRSLDYYAQTNFLFVICLSVFRLQWNPIAPSKRRDI